jgi:hypothetical protein
MAIKAFKTVTLRNWPDLQRRAKPGWIYRGHREANWKLETSFERCCRLNGIRPKHWEQLEQELLREFRRAYHQYSPSAPHRRAVLEWMSLMQHHGAPTRLLDFTYSIQVAAYFAIEAADEDSAIWAVNAAWAMERSSEALIAAGKPVKKVEALPMPWREGTEAAILPELLFESPVKCAIPVNPFRLNDRLRTQRGVFLAPGHIRQSFMQNLEALPGHDRAEHVIRIVVPKTQRRDLLRALHNVNVTRQSLFPGLDGYAGTLAVYHPSFDAK